MCTLAEVAWLPGLTLEPDVKLAVDELIALQHLAQPSPAMLCLDAGKPLAVRQVVVIVCLLWVVVRPHFVDPQLDSLLVLILCWEAGERQVPRGGARWVSCQCVFLPTFPRAQRAL